MIIFKSAAQLSRHLHELKNKGETVGFVPTMGALHKGHLSLIDASRRQNGVTVCSIFINPTQFTNEADFQHYPITIEKDLEALEGVGCDLLFLPAVQEIYPPSFVKRHYELGALEHMLEGHYRPGHFQGVCQVVDRLLEIIPADTLFLGQKDYQQCMVIGRLLSITGRNETVKLAIVPTVREESGLAMSSRNLRLTRQQWHQATAIWKALEGVRTNLALKKPEELKREAAETLTRKGFLVDYFEIANAHTLEPATNAQQPLVALVAATLGNIRLIDNLILN